MIQNRSAVLPGDELAGINPRHVVAEVARKYGLTPAQVRGGWRYADLMAARREIARRLRAAGFSFPAIGRAIARSHNTVIALLRGDGHPQSRGRNWGAVTPPPDRREYWRMRAKLRRMAEREQR